MTKLLPQSHMAMVFALGTASAMAADSQLTITEVNVRFDDVGGDTLEIIGENLDSGWRPLKVTLGESEPLGIISESSDVIEAYCPLDANNFPTCVDGDYLLTVFRGFPPRNQDEHDLTIGAVGPMGD